VKAALQVQHNMDSDVAKYGYSRKYALKVDDIAAKVDKID